MTDQQMIQERTLGITASRQAWHALHVSVVSVDGEIVADASSAYSPHGTVELLLLGVAAVGTRDEQVVLWALGERQRRQEERTRVTAQAREAEAILALAGALRADTETAVLERILPRLSERTQYAVRKQLGELQRPSEDAR
jgi:hypothetical protein